MPGIRVAYRTGAQSPLRKPYPVGNSLTYYNGDLLCISTLAALASGTPALRKLATADATALYETAAGDEVGFLGVAPSDVTINASGISDARPSATTVAANVTPTYQVPNMSASLPADSTPRSIYDVLVVDPETVLGGTLLETTTITETLIGTEVGLSMVVTSGVTAFKFSTAGATKIGTIVDVNKTHRLFNTSGGGGEVFVAIRPEYLQYNNLRNYAT